MAFMAPANDEWVRVAIVGGGISGLAAAHRVRELLPNAELTLFEASSRLGGVKVPGRAVAVQVTSASGSAPPA